MIQEAILALVKLMMWTTHHLHVLVNPIWSLLLMIELWLAANRVHCSSRRHEILVDELWLRMLLERLLNQDFRMVLALMR